MMFRKIAIALVATSVLAAPVMAQTMQGNTSKATPVADTLEKTDKTADKSAENSVTTDKAVTKHQKMVRHHHGAKTAKLAQRKHTKTAMHGKHNGAKSAKLAKGKTPGKRIYGSAKKSPKMTRHVGHASSH
jgi:hypothetical protein